MQKGTTPLKYVINNCLHCNKNFDALLIDVKRGRGRFCSLTCSARSNGAKFKKQPNLECAYCAKTFYRNASNQKNKSGFQFCSKPCKDSAQRKENADTFSGMMPDHYGTGSVSKSKYRLKAFQHKPRVCEECSYDSVPEILQVHHIDRNRKNNHISNLRILCPNCHQIDHFRKGDGSWSINKRKLVESEEVESSSTTCKAVVLATELRPQWE